MAEYAEEGRALQCQSMSPEQEAPRALAWQTPLRGLLEVPGSKSIAQRALLLGALAPGQTQLLGDFSSADVQHMLCTFEELDWKPKNEHGGLLTLMGGLHPSPGRRVYVGESGTGGRLWSALIGLGGLGPDARGVGAHGSLCRRRSGALLKALEGAGAGVTVTHPERGDFPLTLVPVPAGELGSLELANPNSSQEVTGLLLGLAARPDRCPLRVQGVIPSEPYVQLTLGVLERFGVRARWEREAEASSFVLEGELRAPKRPFTIEPDASGAAVALAAGCLSGGDVSVRGLDSESLQGDVAIVRHLQAFGCDAGFDKVGVWARGMPNRGAELDLTGEPDLAPVLAAVAAGAAFVGGGPSRLTGLGTLPGKESDRLAVLQAGLTELGFQVHAGPDELRIARGMPHAEARVLDPHGDHRMAFAFALLSLFLKGVQVSEPECVLKSWPTFWRDLTQ
ncbi:MAG: 3-phosphoshikimate 1-carboxyvinyltransferase [Planctomycetota bacterium]|jgi:3-phosphoshikimate 1-carboxyvinyltransferase